MRKPGKREKCVRAGAALQTGWSRQGLWVCVRDKNKVNTTSHIGSDGGPASNGNLWWQTGWTTWFLDFTCVIGKLASLKSELRCSTYSIKVIQGWIISQSSLEEADMWIYQCPWLQQMCRGLRVRSDEASAAALQAAESIRNSKHALYHHPVIYHCVFWLLMRVSHFSCTLNPHGQSKFSWSTQWY